MAFYIRNFERGDADGLDKPICLAGDTQYVKTIVEEKTDEIIGCGGVTIYAPGMGVAWLLIKNPQKAPKTLFAGAAELVRKAIEEKQLRRVWATLREDRLNELWAWFKHLGFEFEGVMRKNETDGTNSLLFSRVQ